MAGSLQAFTASSRPYSPQSRAERLIGAGRIVLAAFSLLAVRLNPPAPAEHARVTYLILVGYAVYAAFIALVVRFCRWPVPRLPLITHMVDLAVFTGLMYLTEGPESPFFIFFVFFMVSATLRWQSRGALRAGLAALGTYLVMGLYARLVLRGAVFELDDFILRSASLAVLAFLLYHLSAYEERVRGEMAKLAAWSHSVPPDMRAAFLAAARGGPARAPLLRRQAGDDR